MKTEKQTKVYIRIFTILSATVLYGALMTGIGYGLSWLYSVAMETWGVTAGNLQYAPWWVKVIAYGYSGYLPLLQWLVCFVCVRLIGGKSSAKRDGLARGAAWGTGLAAACTALLWLLDGLRAGRPFDMPYPSWNLLLCFCAALGTAMGGELFFRGFLYRRVKDTVWGLPAVCLLFGLLHGIQDGFSVTYFVNACLLSCAACLLYDRSGSWMSTAALRCAYQFVSVGILGINYAGGLYEFYYAARDTLSGGSKGPMAGLIMTLLLLALSAWWGRDRLHLRIRR